MVMMLICFFGKNCSWMEGLDILFFVIFLGFVFIVFYVLTGVFFGFEFFLFMGGFVGFVIVVMVVKKGFLVFKI